MLKNTQPRALLFPVIAITLMFGFSQTAYATCYCWIDAKTGKQVATAPFGGANLNGRSGAGLAVFKDGDVKADEATDSRTGREYVRLPNGHCWIDANTGKEVATAPFGGENLNGRSGAGLAVFKDGDVKADEATDSRTGREYVRVPCPEETTSMTPPPRGGGSSTLPLTPAAQIGQFYVGFGGNANFALSSSQTLTFNTDGHSDKEVANSHSAVGGGGTVSVGYNFGSIEDAQTNPLEGNSLPPSPSFSQRLDVSVEGNFSYSDTSIETPFGASTLHFNQNLYTIGADARLGVRTGTPFTPFILGGFGLGISQGSFKIDGGGANLSLGSTTALAPVAQLGAGVDFKIAGSWSLRLEGKAAIPMNDYDYRLNNVGSLGGGDAAIKSSTPINLGIDLGAKVEF